MPVERTIVRRPWVKKSLLALSGSAFTLCVLIASYLLYLYQHREFTPTELEHTLVSDHLVDLPRMNEIDKERVINILHQPFSYLDLGQQMTAYESADHQYVLKLFNPRSKLRTSVFRDWKKIKSLLSKKWFLSAYFQKKQRLLKLYERYAFAFREMKEEVGLVYVHLSPASQLSFPFVTVSDKDGTSYTLDLCNRPFVLQRKAELALVRFDRQMRENDWDGLQISLTELKNLFWFRAKKGITDRNQTLHNNYGFVGDKAIQIDVGHVRVDKQVLANPASEVEKVIHRIQTNHASLKDLFH